MGGTVKPWGHAIASNGCVCHGGGGGGHSWQSARPEAHGAMPAARHHRSCWQATKTVVVYGTSANPPAEVSPPAGVHSALGLLGLSPDAAAYSFFIEPRPLLPLPRPLRPPLEPLSNLTFLVGCCAASAASVLVLTVMSSEG